MIFFYFLYFLNAENSSSNDSTTPDIWFINDDKKKIVCDISISSVRISSKILFCNNTNSYLENPDEQLFGKQYEIKIKGTSFSNNIMINSTLVNIILDNVKIKSQSSFVVDSSTVYLFILGDSNLIISSNDAGIQCSNSFIQIMNATSQEKIKNTISVSSEKYAGIGGGSSNTNCKGIFIYGGRIISNGGEFGAGIGGGDGQNNANSAGVNRIEIINADVTSTGGKHGAGIGGGSGKSESSSRVEYIKIYGGKVQAVGGEFAAGIGGGYGASKSSSTVGSVEIIGGEISAKGGSCGAGIGNGYSSDREGSTVSKIVLDTTTVISNSVDKNVICTTIDATKGEKAKKAIGAGFSSEAKPPEIVAKGSTISCQNDDSICSFSLSGKSCIKPWKCSASGAENCPKCANENCLSTNAYCVCNVCKEGFLVKDGICVTPSNSSSGTCANSIDNCVEYLNDNCRICDKCSPGFTPSQDRSMCVTCLAEDAHCKKFKVQCQCEICEPGFAPDSSAGFKCQKCTSLNCAVCDNNDITKCQICAAGYTKTNDQQCQKCTFQDPYKETEFVCMQFQQGACICEKCQSGFFREDGKCIRCSEPHCNECAEAKDKCTACAAGFKPVYIPNTTSGVRCESCNSPNCAAYSFGCTCSSCLPGFSLQNGACVNSPIVTSTPVVTPSPDFDAKKISGIAFCPNDMFSVLCNEIQNSWNNLHKPKLIEFAKNKMNDMQTDLSMKYSYKKMLETVQIIDVVQCAISNNISSVLSNLKPASNEVCILQFGSMQPNQFYDLNSIHFGHAIVQIFTVNGYVPEMTSYEIPKISIFGGKFKRIESLSCYCGNMNFSSLVEVNKLVLVAPTLGSESLSVKTNLFIIDSHSISVVNRMKISSKSFGVVLPETTYVSNSLNLSIAENAFILATMNSFVVSIPSSLASEQIMVITTINSMLIKLDPSSSSKTVNKILNISLQNENLNGQSFVVNFDQILSNWKNTKFKKNLIVEYQSPSSITLQNKPDNLNIVINQRNKNGQIVSDKKNSNKNTKVSGLPDSAISALIASFMLGSLVLILSAYFYFRKKPKVKNHHTKDSSTPLLNQIFNDGF